VIRASPTQAKAAARAFVKARAIDAARHATIAGKSQVNFKTKNWAAVAFSSTDRMKRHHQINRMMTWKQVVYGTLQVNFKGDSSHC
jgi:hypothetical protein